MQALLALAQNSGVIEKRTDLFAGIPMNTTEKRAVLHPALRGSCGDNAITKQVKDMRASTRKFAEKI